MKKTANKTTAAPKTMHATTPEPEEADAHLMPAEALTYSLVSTVLKRNGFQCSMKGEFLEIAGSARPIIMGIDEDNADDKAFFLAVRHSVRSDVPAEAGLFLVNELNRQSLLPSYFLSEGAASSSPLSVWEDTVPNTVTGHTHIPVMGVLVAEQMVRIVRAFQAETVVANNLIMESGLHVDSDWQPGAN